MTNINILYSKKAIPLRGSVNLRLPTIGTAIEDWQLQSGFTCVYTIFTWNFQISQKVIKRTERVLLYGSPSVSSSDTLITMRHFSVLITKSSASKQKFILTIDPWSLILDSVIRSSLILFFQETTGLLIDEMLAVYLSNETVSKLKCEPFINTSTSRVKYRINGPVASYASSGLCKPSIIFPVLKALLSSNHN